MIGERIKQLRISRNMTQASVAKKLGITRAGVNAWEMGISTPSTQYIIKLSLLFDISSDYILGLQQTSTINVSELSEQEVIAVQEIVDCLRNK